MQIVLVSSVQIFCLLIVFHLLFLDQIILSSGVFRVAELAGFNKVFLWVLSFIFHSCDSDATTCLSSWLNAALEGYYGTRLCVHRFVFGQTKTQIFAGVYLRL